MSPKFEHLILSKENETFAEFWKKVNGEGADGEKSNMQKIEDFMTAAAQAFEDCGNTTYIKDAKPTFQSSKLYDGYLYVGIISSNEITADMTADVIFSHDDALSGEYSPVCDTAEGEVRIYAKTNKSVTIPLIRLFRGSL